MAEINQTSTPLAAAPGRVLPAMCMLILGKVEAVRRYESKSYTRVICPAPDLYSKPSVVEIRSSGRIGARDEEVKVVGRLSGYTRKPYRVTDKESGEISNITPVDHTVDLVE
jgi:hypothetical protein